MADQPAPGNADLTENSGKKKRLPTVLIVGALMLVEGVAIYCAVDYFSDDPATAAAKADAEGETAPAPEDETVELVVAECRSVNNKEGRMYFYNIRVSVLVRQDQLERLTKLVETRRSRIDERVNVVVRSAEPKHMNEPGFESLKRRFRAELSELFGDDKLILDVFIPELIRTKAGV